MARPTITRVGTTKPAFRNAVYAAAVLALWTSAGLTDAQSIHGAAAVADDAAKAEPPVRAALMKVEEPAPLALAVDEPPATTPATMPTPPEKPTPAPQPTTVAPPTTPANANNAVSNNTLNFRTSSNGVSPVLLIGFAVFCTAFLALWSRRRRGGGQADGGGASSAAEKSGGDAKKGQYSRVDTRAEEHELLEDEFGGRSGSWDDWESHNPSQRIDVRPEEDEEDHRDTAKLTRGLSSSSSSSSSSAALPQSRGSVRTSTAGVRLSSPPTSGRGGGAAPLQHDRLKEIMLSDLKPPKASSVGSNSSNESYEVVVSPPAAVSLAMDLLSGSLSPPAHHQSMTDAGSAQTPAPAHTSGEDDLFSQFGLVPTFKKGVQQAPAPAPARSSYSSPAAAAGALNPFAVSPPPSASSLFAADLDDLSVEAHDGANEWGDEEDDDWVQGL